MASRNTFCQGISPLIATSWERCNKLMKRETWNVPH
ncbi:hypothetical protein, partial [Escherichia coli]